MPPKRGDKYSILLIAGDESSHILCLDAGKAEIIHGR